MPNTLLDPKEDLSNRESGDFGGQPGGDELNSLQGDNQDSGGRSIGDTAENARDIYKKFKPEGGAGAGASEAGATGAGTGGATAGAGAGTAGAGATGGTAAAAGAGTAGTGAAAAGAGTGAAASAGAAAGGAAAGTAAAGTAAAGGAATGAAGAAAAAGTATAETGVGAIIGYGIALGILVVQHRKEVAAIGSILFVGGLIVITAFLNSLKPIAAAGETNDTFAAPVQQIVDNRSVQVLGSYVMEATGVGSTENQEHVASSGSGHVLPAVTAGGGKLKTLYEAMKTNGFEARLKDKYALEFKPNGGVTQIIHKGKVLGDAHNKEEATIILKTKFPAIQELLGEDVNGWSWAQHTKVARAVNRGGFIPSLAIPNAEKANSDPEVTDVIKYQYSTIQQPGLANMQQGVTCFTQGTGCNATNTAVEPEAEAGYQDDERSSMTKKTQATYTENLENIKPENGFQTLRLDTTAGQKVTDTLGQQAVGLLGWLDIAATTLKMSQKEGAQQLPAMLRAKQAGAMWAWNISAVNQMLAGDVSSRSAALITRNYANIEDSQGFNFVSYNDTSRGQGMADSEKVNSKYSNSFTYTYQALSSERPILQAAIRVAFEAWLIIHGSFVGTIIDIAARTPIGSFINYIAAALLDKVGVLPFIEQSIGVSSRILLPVCDAADETLNFFNCMTTGAHESYNRACVAMGCGNITVAQDNALRIASRQDRQARLAAMPLEKRLFDQKVPGSFINVAALNSPLPIKATSNMASLVQGVFSAVWSAPSKAASLAASPAKAASVDSSVIDGIGHVGIPLETINSAPLSAEVNTNSACPQKPAGEVNLCLADMATVDSLIARYTLNPAYGG